MNDTPSNTFTHEEILRYSRHLLIPEVGIAGQKALKNASMLIVGTGGLGSPIAIYLAAAGVGHLGLVDDDTVDLSNLQRQIIHGTETLGERKVISARRRLKSINPTIAISTFDEPFTVDNALKLAEAFDILIDATDNFPTRYLLNDVAVLTHKPMVYGSVYQFEGQVSVFHADEGPCYRCIFPDPPPPGLVPACGEDGVFSVLPGTIGTIQAAEAIKLVLGIGHSLCGRLLLYDTLEMSFDTINLKKNPHCRICSDCPQIDSLIDYEAFCGVPGHREPTYDLPAKHTISVCELFEQLSSQTPPHLVDVREPHELEISSIPGAQVIPLGSLASHLEDLDQQDDIVLISKAGSRSARALEILIGAGFPHVKNLHGGINAWAAEIDPDLPLY